MRLADELDRAIGDGPPHPPVEHRLQAGRRAVRRRRGAASVAVAAVAVVAGGAWTLVGPGGSTDSGPAPFTRDPGEGETSEPVPGGPSLGFSGAGCDLVGDAVDVVDEVDDPYDRAGDGCERALAYTEQGSDAVQWLLLAGPADDGPAEPVVGPVPATGDRSFRAWVRDQAPPEALAGPLPAPVEGLVELRDDETLEPVAPGAEVVDQTAEPELPESFAAPDDASAAAEVELAGRTYFVLARTLGTGRSAYTDYIVDGADGDETLAQFLERARETYASGEGLL